MINEKIILLAEDDEGHATLIKKNLIKAGIKNQILHFPDGEKIINYLYSKEKRSHDIKGNSLIILLDIKMPKKDGIEVLNQIKKDKELKKIPIIIFTTTDNPNEVELCYNSGCNSYLTKSLDYNEFVEKIQILGSFIKEIKIPIID